MSGIPVTTSAERQLAGIWTELGGQPGDLTGVRLTGTGAFDSAFAVSDFAVACTAAVGSAVAELVASSGVERRPEIAVDRALASAWFLPVTRGIGWPPSTGNELTGEYPTRDGRWIRFQMNYPRIHRATLAALDCAPDRSAMADVVARHDGQDIEDAVVAGGGAAALARSAEEWGGHAQGRAVEGEPLVFMRHDRGQTAPTAWRPLPERPLAGIRVLDLTRVLAGPMATRLLASFGATVLRIDPPGYEEPRGGVETTLGKRCARLDLTSSGGHDRLLELLRETDVFVHGYRPGVLERLGLGPDLRRETRPGLVEVTLNAYGWSGPWSGRRGFDTVVEMSTGMALTSSDWASADRPVLMPVQALDHGTGHLLAAAVIRGLMLRQTTGEGSRWRCSLARTAKFLVDAGPGRPQHSIDLDALPTDGRVHATPRGPAHRLSPPLRVGSARQYWDRPGEYFGSSTPMWPSR